MIYLLTGATGATTGSFVKVGNGSNITYLHKYAVQFWWDITPGESITVLVIKIWGSSDGIHTPGEPVCIHTATADELTATGGKFNIVNVPACYLKAQISTLTKTGGTVDMDVVLIPSFLRTL